MGVATPSQYTQLLRVDSLREKLSESESTDEILGSILTLAPILVRDGWKIGTCNSRPPTSTAYLLRYNTC